MSDAESLEGGCACGAVRYRLNSAPLFVHCCHCTRCQRETGTAFVLNALIEAEQVELLQGEPEPAPVPSDSGRDQIQWRCPTCRIALWANYGRAGAKLRFVKVGTLDTPAALTPDVHIYTRSKLPWVRLPDDAAQYESFYDIESTWPKESLSRRAALRS